MMSRKFVLTRRQRSQVQPSLHLGDRRLGLGAERLAEFPAESQRALNQMVQRVAGQTVAPEPDAATADRAKIYLGLWKIGSGLISLVFPQVDAGMKIIDGTTEILEATGLLAA